MRLIIGVFALLFAMAGLGLALDNINGMPYKVTSHFFNNTYMITNNVVPGKRRGNGTGIWLDSWHMLTNCHVSKGVVAKDDSTIYAINYKQTEVFKMNVLACDEKEDLSLLRSDWPNHTVDRIKIDYRQPRFGSILFSAGYHLNMPLSPKVGYMGQVEVHYEGLRAGLSMPITSGDSGSPVFDKWGSLIGIISSVYGARTYEGRMIPIASISAAIPAISINTFLDKYMEGYNEN